MSKTLSYISVNKVVIALDVLDEATHRVKKLGLSIDLRAGPSAKDKLLNPAERGLLSNTFLKVTTKQGNWSNVVVLSGEFAHKVGWVETKFIESLTAKKIKKVKGKYSTGETPDLEVVAPGDMALLRQEPKSVDTTILATPFDGDLLKKLTDGDKFTRVKIVATAEKEDLNKTGWILTKVLKPLKPPPPPKPPPMAPKKLHELDPAKAFTLIRDRLSSELLSKKTGIDNLNLKDTTQDVYAQKKMWLDHDVGAPDSIVGTKKDPNGFAYFAPAAGANATGGVLRFQIPYVRITLLDYMTVGGVIDYTTKSGEKDTKDNMVENGEEIMEIEQKNEEVPFLVETVLRKKFIQISPAVEPANQKKAKELMGKDLAQWEAELLYKYSLGKDPYPATLFYFLKSIETRKYLAALAKTYLGLNEQLFYDYLEKIGGKGVKASGVNAGVAGKLLSYPMSVDGAFKPVIIDSSPRCVTWQMEFDLQSFVNYATEVSGPVATYNNIFTKDGLKAITNVVGGTLYGASKVHGLIGSSFFTTIDGIRLTATNDKLKSGFDHLQKRLRSFSDDLEVGDMMLVDTKEKPIPNLDSQLSFLRVYPTQVKAALMQGAATSESMSAAEYLTVSHIFKFKTDGNGIYKEVKLIALFVEPSPVSDDSVGTRVQVITKASSVTGKPEQEILMDGRLALLDKTIIPPLKASTGLYDTFQEEITAIFVDFAALAAKKNESLGDYILKQEDEDDDIKQHWFLLWILATVVQDAFASKVAPFVVNNSIDKKFSMVPLKEDVDLSKLVTLDKDGKLLTDYYSSLTNWLVGFDAATDKTLEFKPNFIECFKELAYLDVSDDGKTISFDWDVLNTKLFTSETHEAFKEYGPYHYSSLFRVHDTGITLNHSPAITNYKDFFDRLYLPEVLYKSNPPPPPPSPQPSGIEAKVQKTGPLQDHWSQSKWSPTFQIPGLTPKQSQKAWDKQLKDRYKIVEEAFGDTGCLEEALKIVKTFDDIYDVAIGKINWPVFMCQIIDRFKCEAAKMGIEGGESLDCLADFDVCGTWNKGLETWDIIQHYPDILKHEMKKQPLPGLVAFAFDHEVPNLPDLDWFKCLKELLIALIYKLIREMILLFLRMLLSLLDICPIKHHGCDHVEADPTSNNHKEEAKGDIASTGLSPADAAKAVNELNVALNNLFTPPGLLRALLVMLAKNLTAQQLKALFLGEAPPKTFNYAKWIVKSMFKTAKLTDQEINLIFITIGRYYNFDVLDAVAIVSAILSDEDCPPELSGDGKTPLDAIKDMLAAKLAQAEADYEAAVKAAAALGVPPPKKPKEASEAELDKKINAFCEVLKGVNKFLQVVQDLPSMVAGFSEFAMEEAIQLMLSQLKIKAHYDFYLLRYLFTGEAWGEVKPNDILTADMSLAYNILYNTFYLMRAGHGSSKKNWDVYAPSLQHMYQTEVVHNDGFNEEFIDDMWGLINLWGYMPPWGPFVYEPGRRFIYDSTSGNIRPFSEDMLDVSRKVNNPNFWYGWLEELLAMLPIPMFDPRRFGAKFPYFVEQHYPNANPSLPGVSSPPLWNKKKRWRLGQPEKALIIQPYKFKLSQTGDGIRCYYGNGQQTLLDLTIGINSLEVKMSQATKSYTRPLPSAREPFVAANANPGEFQKNKYSPWIKDAVSPQEEIFAAVCGKFFLDNDIKVKPATRSKIIAQMVKPTYDTYYKAFETLISSAFLNSDYAVRYFFLSPYFDSKKARDIMAPLIKGLGQASKQLKEDIEDLGFPIFGSDEDDVAESQKKVEVWQTLVGTALKGLMGQFSPEPPVVSFFNRMDGNIMSQVLYPDKPGADSYSKFKKKLTGGLKKAGRDAVNGTTSDPNRLASKITTSDNTALYYAIEKEMAEEVKLAGKWLRAASLSKDQQIAILTIIKKKIGDN